MQISSGRQAIAQNVPFEEMFCELYSRKRQSLCEYVLNMVQRKDVAEDICHDVFAKLWSCKDKYAAIVEDYEAFLFRMAYNEAISYIRREKQSKQVFKNVNTQISSALNLTEQTIYQRELEGLLQQAIQNLSPQCKKVYLLCKMEGLPLDKVAVILSVSYQTVKNQMHTANLQIRKHLNENLGMGRKRKCNYNKGKRFVFEQAKTLRAA